jgi:hypothetical protein
MAPELPLVDWRFIDINVNSPDNPLLPSTTRKILKIFSYSC